ncbi:MAG: hypothetical protein ACRDRE_00670 [Pseudonocardiaceae bacterium]
MARAWLYPLLRGYCQARRVGGGFVWTSAVVEINEVPDWREVPAAALAGM